MFLTYSRTSVNKNTPSRRTPLGHLECPLTGGAIVVFKALKGHEVPGVVVWRLLLYWGLGWEMLGDISYDKAILKSEGK